MKHTPAPVNPAATPARRSLIASRFAALFGAALSSGLLPVSRAEIRAEGCAARSRATLAGDDSLATGDEIGNGIPSALPFEAARISAPSEKDYLLTADERKELSRVWQPKRRLVMAAPSVAADDLLPPDFVPSPVAEYVPIVSPEIAAATRALLAFEADAAALPLRLCWHG